MSSGGFVRMDPACMIAMDPKAIRGMSVQIMEPDDVTLLRLWAAEGSDLVEFEIVPVAPGKNLAAAMAGLLKVG